jgi:hypothetical protein
MKKLTMFAWAVLVLAATACTVDSTPQLIVASASSALRKNNLGQFKEALSGSALEQYGTQEGMTILQNKLAGQKLRTTAPQSIAVDPSQSGQLSVYTVSVLNRSTDAKLLDLTVNCNYDNTVPPPTCGNPLPDSCGIAQNPHCSIDAIQISN